MRVTDLFKKLEILALIFLLLGFLSCSHSSDDPTPANDQEPVTEEIFSVPATNPVIQSGKDGKTWAQLGKTSTSAFVNIIFDYPTVKVDGSTVTASAVISMSASLYNAAAASKNISYVVLNNHGSQLKGDSTPTTGAGEDFADDVITNNANAVIVAADYIGFGTTSSLDQAYCFGEVNAHASLDALRNAKVILESKGFSWSGSLYNVGYSQGGQTAMAIQKLVDTKNAYSYITITKTFAGGGLYSMKTTAEESLKITGNNVLMPHVTLLCMYTYNKYKNLGYTNDAMFQHYDDGDEDAIKPNLLAADVSWKTEWFGSHPLTYFIKDAFLPAVTSTSGQKGANYDAFVSAFEEDWCYWTPKSTTKIVIFHVSNDDVVPKKNADDLYAYFTAHGYSMQQATSSSATFEGNKYVTYSITPDYTTGNLSHNLGFNNFQEKVVDQLP